MKKFTDEQKKEILAFAAENTIAKASKKFGVSEAIVYRWKGKVSTAKPSYQVSSDDNYFIVKIPKKMVAKEILGGLLG